MYSLKLHKHVSSDILVLKSFHDFIDAFDFCLDEDHAALQRKKSRPGDAV